TQRLAGRPNVELRFGDAVKLDLAEAAPGATKLIANLPYNVATPLIAESLDRLPGIELWTVMVQREVAGRFFAAPSTKAYGAVSVLVQLVAERTGFHPVSPTVFRPRPNVDSALVAFRRTGLPHDFRRVKRVVEGSFAHRRKRLANSLELAGVAERGRAEAAIAAIGRQPNVRAEELAPHEFLALAAAWKRRLRCAWQTDCEPIPIPPSAYAPSRARWGQTFRTSWRTGPSSAPAMAPTSRHSSFPRITGSCWFCRARR